MLCHCYKAITIFPLHLFHTASVLPSIIKIYTLYLTNSVHNAATLLRAEIYSPIICGCLLLHLNSTHSVSSGNFASYRTRLLKYSTNLIAITSHTFFQSTEITHKLLSDSMRWLFNIFLSTNISFIGVISGKIPNPYFLLFIPTSNIVYRKFLLLFF